MIRAMPKHVTLADIAEQSQVSLSTVSLVLRNRPGITEETRQRVLTVAQELGYRLKGQSNGRMTNTQANGGQVKRIGLVVKTELNLPPQTNLFYAQVLAGIAEACRQKQINLLYSLLPVDEHSHPTTLPHLLDEDPVDGILLVGAYVPLAFDQFFAERALPVVLVDAYAASGRYDAVVSDNRRGAYEAVDYLLQRGHRHIAIVGSQPDAYPSICERREGYEQALRDRGVAERYFTASSLNPEETSQAVTALLTAQPQITALFGCNDSVAIAASRSAQMMGRRLPEELAVIGYDDVEMAQHVTPSLTTLQVDKISMGRLAVQLLLNRVEYPEANYVTLTLRPRLVERHSVLGR
jgi:LacI family transcriptional regulator